MGVGGEILVADCAQLFGWIPSWMTAVPIAAIVLRAKFATARHSLFKEQ